MCRSFGLTMVTTNITVAQNIIPDQHWSSLEKVMNARDMKTEDVIYAPERRRTRTLD